MKTGMNIGTGTLCLLVCTLLIGLSDAANAATATANPTSCSSVSGIGTIAWTNAGNAVANDGNVATASIDDGQVTRYLQCTGYNFSIPSGAAITGITVNVERSATASGIQDAAMRVVKGGVIGTTDRSTSTAYPISLTYEAHGGASDLWGTTWAASDINAANFGAAFAAQKPGTSGGARTVSVDHVQISVDYTVPFSCTQPANTPSGLTLTCVCDTFGRASLNPSTIFGADWIVSTSDQTGIVPSIANSGFLRLTNNTGNNAKAATVPGIFPAAGNYISVEFQQYAYNGSGADGIAVTLSDYSVPAVPGAFGGSLGYAQKTGAACNTTSCPGFAGGWVGVALDEYGNYQNPTEGRIGGPGAIVESVGVRGSGAGVGGYNWIAGTNALNPLIDDRTSTTPSLGNYYQVIVDARSEPTSTAVAVNRNTGSGYASLITIPNIYTAASAQGFTQAPVPSNWQISFTGSTGGATNIHEISGLRICAQTVVPPTGGTAAGFNAIDEAYSTPPIAVQNYLNGHIYAKLMGVAFKLDVAALSNNQIQTNYVVGSTSSKSVTVKLVDNSDNVCVLDSSQAGYCSNACTSKTAVSGGSQTLIFVAANAGQKQSASFTLNTAYKNLVAIIGDGTVTACSTDAFSVRPSGVASVTASNATNFRAGTDLFSLTATTTGISGNASGYTGVLKINNAAIQPSNPATVAGSVTGTFQAAVSGTSSSTATGPVTAFSYSEVGDFLLPGFDPASNTTSQRGVYDGVTTAVECVSLNAAACDLIRANTWTGVDSISSKGDCIVDNYTTIKDAAGKYGCNFGLIAPTLPIGRFIPDHFTLVSAQTRQRSDLAAAYAATGSTTGTIALSSTALTVASATGFAAGDAVVIFGAGMSGKDLATTIASVAGNVLNLNASALTAIATATPVFKRLGFTYMDEPLQLKFDLEARNGADAITLNYTTVSGLAKLTNARPAGTINDSWGIWGVVNNVNGLANCRAVFSTLGPSYNTSYTGAGCPVTTPYAAAAARVSTGNTIAVNWLAGAATLTTNVTLQRALGLDGPFDVTNGTFALGIWPIDNDGVTLATATKNLDTDTTAGADRVVVGLGDMRFGRLRLFNTWGSDLANMRIPLKAQYWNGQTWAQNEIDNASVIPLASIALSGHTGLTTSNMSTANLSSAGTLMNSSGSIVLRCPYLSTVGCPPANNPSPKLTGSVDLAINLGSTTADSSCLANHPATTGAGLPWLRSQSGACVATYDRDPSGRMSFGIATPETNRSVHIRELF